VEEWLKEDGNSKQLIGIALTDDGRPHLLASGREETIFIRTANIILADEARSDESLN